MNYPLEAAFLGGVLLGIINYGWSFYAGIKTKDVVKRYFIGFYRAESRMVLGIGE